MARSRKKADAPQGEQDIVADAPARGETQEADPKPPSPVRVPPRPRSPRTTAAPLPNSTPLPGAAAPPEDDTRTQLAALLELCGKFTSEFGSLREHAASLHHQLTSDTETVRQALAEAREAAEANREVLRGASEGVETLARECAAAANKASALREQAAGEAEEARASSRAAAQAQESMLEGLRREASALREATQAASQSVGRLPAEASELHSLLASAGVQVRGLEESVEAARRKRDRIEEEIETARARLEVALRETAEAEGRLASLRLEVEDGLRRVEYARKQAEHAATVAEPVPPEPVQPGRLGLTVAPALLVAEVELGSPADEAGLAAGDVIASVNGEAMGAATQLREKVSGLAENDGVNIRFRRGSVEHDARVRIPQAKETQ